MAKTRPARDRSEIAPELARLWVTYKDTGAMQAREGLILHYAPLVKYVASRVATGLPATWSRRTWSPTECSA